MEAAKNRFVKIDGSGDLLQRSGDDVRVRYRLLNCLQNRTILPVVTSLWLRVTLASANEWKLLKIDLWRSTVVAIYYQPSGTFGSQGRVGSSITTHRVRMKLSRPRIIQVQWSYMITRERQWLVRVGHHRGGNTKLLSFCVRLLHDWACWDRYSMRW